jgi:ATP-binding cassette subfamily B protein
LILLGKVRLKEADKTKKNLIAKDWFGDLLKLSGQFEAVAASKEVVVMRWHTALSTELSSSEIYRY